MLPSSDSGYDRGLQPLVDQAVADLAVRLGVEPETISIESAELVTWTNRGFLGSSAELRHTQVPIDGSEIVLRCEGHDAPGPYRYRTGGHTYRPTLYLGRQP